MQKSSTQAPSANDSAATEIENRFCWAELAAGELPRARRFYEALFAWPFQEHETPAGPYQVFAPEHGPGGGIMQRMPTQAPAWMPYVHVASLEETLDKAHGLGASPLMPPTAIADGSRIAWIQDPEGAPLGLYQGPDECKGAPAETSDGDAFFSFFEATVSDFSLAREFYAELFDWRLEEVESAGRPYLLVHTGEGGASGGFVQKRDVALPSAWLPYVRVHALDASLARAAELGAQIAAPRSPMSCGATAVVRDLEGACLGLAETRE